MASLTTSPGGLWHSWTLQRITMHLSELAAVYVAVGKVPPDTDMTIVYDREASVLSCNARLDRKSLRNSQVAVEKYLSETDLAQHVDHVAARTSPYLLKPNPHLILRSIDEFDGDPESFVLVGDSVSDIEAARAAGIHQIGFANKPGKFDRLTGQVPTPWSHPSLN